MRAALYARVSTERQADRGTIGSQLQLLREHIAAAGDELIGEYVDDGHSGARLDRPALDALRDAAEAGLVERVWCLSPDRLARAYAYQVLVLDELDRFGVSVAFTDSPGLAADDPQATLLTQVQGVIAEYEKAKIAERYRRGKLFRARAGEIVTWKASYGYRRIPRSAATGQAHHEIYEPEAAVVRRIFTDRAAGITVREICRRLNADGIPSPTGKPTWGHSTLSRLLRNEAYVGRVYYNRTESVPDRNPTRHNRQVPRDRDEWITIECPRIISDEPPVSLRVTPRRRENGVGSPADADVNLGFVSLWMSLVPGPDLEGSRTVASSTPVRLSVPLTEAPRRPAPCGVWIWLEDKRIEIKPESQTGTGRDSRRRSRAGDRACVRDRCGQGIGQGVRTCRQQRGQAGQQSVGRGRHGRRSR